MSLWPGSEGQFVRSATLWKESRFVVKKVLFRKCANLTELKLASWLETDLYNHNKRNNCNQYH